MASDLSEDSLSAFIAEEIPAETLPYLYILILAEILNRVQDDEYNKSEHKSGDREKDKGISSTGFDEEYVSSQKGFPVIPLIASQFTQEVDDMNNSYKSKKNTSTTGGGHGCIAELNSDFIYKNAKEQLTNVPSIIRNEYKAIKITAMLPTAILVTG